MPLQQISSVYNERTKHYHAHLIAMQGMLQTMITLFNVPDGCYGYAICKSRNF